MRSIKEWWQRKFGDPQIIALGIIMAIIIGVIWFFGNMLIPVLASIVVAYLLDGFVVKLEKKGIPHLISVIIVFMLFLIITVLIIIGIVPLLSEQVTDLGRELPGKMQEMIVSGQEFFDKIKIEYPALFRFGADGDAASVSTDAALNLKGMSVEPAAISVVTEKIVNTTATAQAVSQNVMQEPLFTAEQLRDAISGILSIFSVESFVAVITVMVYMVIMPILIFFFLKDKELIINWCLQFLPSDRKMVSKVWKEVDVQIGNYVRGKLFEVVIVGIVTYITFIFFNVKFSLLLGVLVGLSVIVPYVGAAVVTIPVILLGYAQFGWGAEFGYLMIAYTIVQALDGNALVPLLFSGVVNIHPVAIIVAILVFGGMWGVWGVFFAIPLATFIQAVINAWPKATFSAQKAKIKRKRGVA
ncbi:MAG: AI-2E family transporter [Gammaproteobacteria bacterium]|nr:MAG: AI-2E family transporter [Gammaproteobacteria bacterium]